MHPRQPVPASLLRLADLQAGAVTREQALGSGLSGRAIDRLLVEGRWTRLARGVVSVVPPTPAGPAWLTLAWAGCLLGGDRARLAGLAAGHVWGLCDAPDGPIMVMIPSGKAAPEGTLPWSFRRERDGVRDPRSPGSPPRTTLEDTAVDLVDADGDAIGWLSAALQTRRTSVRRLRHCIDTRRRLAHRRDALAVLADLAAGAESALEMRYLHDVERAHGLPAAERQMRRRGTVADALYRAYGVVVELDGRRGHEAEGRFRDMSRDNAATTDGLATLRYGWRDVDTRACEVAAQVAENLVIRGWAGLPTRCRRCRLVA